MITTACQQSVFQRYHSEKTYMRVLPTRWRRKPAAIEITSLSPYVYENIFYWPPLIRGADICAPLRYSRITDIAFWRIIAEMVLSVFRSIVNDVFNFFNAWRPVFCGTVFLLLDCRLFAFTVYGFAERVWEWDGNGNNPICITQWEFHVKKVANTWLPSVGFRSWSRCLAVSLQVTWVINPVVGCHYFLPGPQLPPQPLRGMFLILLLREQRHDGCEQFA